MIRINIATLNIFYFLKKFCCGAMLLCVRKSILTQRVCYKLNLTECANVFLREL